jgi:hypothetical protein
MDFFDDGDEFPTQNSLSGVARLSPDRLGNLRDWSRWWRLLKGANWLVFTARSTVEALENHPVDHGSCEDTLAYSPSNSPTVNCTALNIPPD